MQRSTKSARLPRLLRSVPQVTLDGLHRGLESGRSVAMRAVEVRAINDSAHAFYRKYRFVALLDDKHHLYLSMKQVAKLFPEEVADAEPVE